MRLGKYLSSLTKPELEELTANCGFTDNELVIVKMLRNEKTSVEIANKLFLSVPTIDRRVRKIRNKIERLDDMNGVPIWEKANLTIEEAAEYSNVGIHKIYELANKPNCDFVLFVGKKRLVKRKKFEKFLESMDCL